MEENKYHTRTYVKVSMRRNTPFLRDIYEAVWRQGVITHWRGYRCLWKIWETCAAGGRGKRKRGYTARPWPITNAIIFGLMHLPSALPTAHFLEWNCGPSQNEWETFKQVRETGEYNLQVGYGVHLCIENGVLVWGLVINFRVTPKKWELVLRFVIVNR